MSKDRMIDQYTVELDGIRASEHFRARVAKAMTEAGAGMEHVAEKNGGKAERRSFARRKPLAFAAILAAALLLCAGTAFAIYQSTAERVKERIDEQANLPDDELTRLAEAYADEILTHSAKRYTAEGSATVGDVTIRVKHMDQEPDGEMSLHFGVETKELGEIYFIPFAQAGDAEIIASHEYITQIGEDAYSFVLRHDGKEIPLYTHEKEIGDPAAWLSDGDGCYCLPYHDVGDFRLADGMAMTLAGTLHSYHGDGSVAEKLGDFSIDFTCTRTAADEAAARAELIESYKQSFQENAQARAEEAEKLPLEATEIGVDSGNVRVNDIQQDGGELLIGLTYHTGGVANTDLTVYVDGFACKPLQTETVEGTGDSLEALVRIVVWGAAEEPPERSLIYLCNPAQAFDGGQQTQSELSVVFRYGWRDGSVSLPKDEAERQAWIAESETLRASLITEARNYHYYDHANSTKLNDSDIQQTVNGTSVSIWNVAAKPDGTMLIEYHINPVRCELIAWETMPHITVNGEEAAVLNDAWETDLEEWQEYYWEYMGEKKERYSTDVWSIRLPRRIERLPERFDIVIDWTLGDITTEAEREIIGDFHLTIPVERDTYRTDFPGYFAFH